MSDTPELVPFGDLDDEVEEAAVVKNPGTTGIRFRSVERALALGISRDVVIELFRVDPSLIPEPDGPGLR